MFAILSNCEDSVIRYGPVFASAKTTESNDRRYNLGSKAEAILLRFDSVKGTVVRSTL